MIPLPDLDRSFDPLSSPQTILLFLNDHIFPKHPGKRISDHLCGMISIIKRLKKQNSGSYELWPDIITHTRQGNFQQGRTTMRDLNGRCHDDGMLQVVE